MLLLVWWLCLWLFWGTCICKSLINQFFEGMSLWSALLGNKYMLLNYIVKLFLGVTQAVLIFKPCSYLVRIIYLANVFVCFDEFSDCIMELSETDLFLARFTPFLRQVLNKFSPNISWINRRNCLRLSSDLKIGVANHVWQVRNHPVIQGYLVGRLSHIWIKS